MKKEMKAEILKIIGLKVTSVRGHGKNKNIEPSYIMFDDKETYIVLCKQDEYSYHDCSCSAREIEIYQDKQGYEEIVKRTKIANIDIDYF